MINLKKGSHVHFIGICGTAMASLAGILKDMGYKVTGSDQNVYPPMSTQLEKLGIPVINGYHGNNLKDKPDLVIVGNVISRTNPEAEALLASDIAYTSLPKALGELLIADRHSIVISGTHGKTTTTSMVSVISDECDLQSGFLIGGIPLNYNYSFRSPKGDWFIIEGDEYDTAFFDKVPKFFHYRPRSVIISSIEFDHADIYNSIDEIKLAFKGLIERVPSDGLIVANGNDQIVLELTQDSKARVVTYGWKDTDYTISDRKIVDGRNHFKIVYKDSILCEVAIKSFGKHNTLNALSAFVLGRELGWPLHKILNGLANFKGVKRRQEVIFENDGVSVVEDFAHHPTAVNLTLDMMRERFENKRLIAIFEPRSATSRRKVFQQDYIDAFKNSDLCIIAEPFDQSKIDEKQRFSSFELVEGLKNKGVNALVGKGVDDIIEKVRTNLSQQDVIVIMSNGGFGGIYSKLIDKLN